MKKILLNTFLEKNYTFTLILGVLLFAFQAQAYTRPDGALPRDWYTLPEEDSLSAQSVSGSDSNAEENLGLVLEKIFRANQDALEKLPMNQEILIQPNSMQTFADRPRDWMPWHMEYITTDLGITLQGLIGILTIKATPSFQAFWRRQGALVGPAPTSPQKSPLPQDPGADHPLQLESTARLESINEIPTLEVSEQTTSDDIDRSVEPVIKAAESSGRIKDSHAFRQNLRRATKDLEGMLQTLESHPHSEWWPSRFRFDFTVDAQGNVLPTVSTAAEVRLRFDWKFIRRKVTPSKATALHSNGLAKFKLGLQEFVDSMEQILADASIESPIAHGFVPYQFRVGLGVFAGGRIGMVRGTTSGIGHLYFMREVSKPIVRPRGSNIENSNPDQPILIIEEEPAQSHLDFAQQMNLPFTTSTITLNNSARQVAYQVGRDKILKGVKKAMKIGGFFAKQGAKANHGKWKIHTFYVAFDLSVGGNFGVVTAGGLAATQVYFYNKNF